MLALNRISDKKLMFAINSYKVIQLFDDYDNRFEMNKMVQKREFYPIFGKI